MSGYYIIRIIANFKFMSNQLNILDNTKKLILSYEENQSNKTLNEIRQSVLTYSENYLLKDIIELLLKKTQLEDFKKIILDWRDDNSANDKSANYNPTIFQTGFSLYINNLIEKDNVSQLEDFAQDYSLNLIGIDIIKKILTTKKESKILGVENKCLEFIKNQNLNWDKIFDQIKDIVKNEFFALMLNKEDGIFLQKIMGNKQFPQWLKDTSLLITTQNLNLNDMKYWLEKGADPQLYSLQKNTFILNHKTLLPDTKLNGSYISGASEARELIVSSLPQYFKNDSYLHWNNWVKKMLDSKNKWVNSEIGLYMLNGDIKPTDSKKYSKYAQSMLALECEKFDTLLKEYQDKKLLNSKFNIHLYKYAIVNNKPDHLKILFENSIDEKSYVKSTVCKNIQDNYKISDNVKYSAAVVKLNNEVINFELYNKLNDRFTTKNIEVKKKLKI